MKKRTCLAGFGGILGMLALFSAAPASAQWDWDRRNDRDRREIRRDVEDLRKDQRRLEQLEDMRERQLRRHDYRGARRTEEAIDRLRRDMARDRRDLRNETRGRRYNDRWDNDRW